MVNSRAKGCRGELEAAKAVSEVLGVEARRGQQYCGDSEAPDIKTSLKGVRFEVKRTEKFSLYKALMQATSDSEASGDVPVVLHRSNNNPWVVVVRLADLPKLAERVKTVTEKDRG